MFSNVRISFLFYEYSFVHMDHILFIHAFADGHLGYLHLSAIVNNTAINMGVQISFREVAFHVSLVSLSFVVKWAKNRALTLHSPQGER